MSERELEQIQQTIEDRLAGVMPEVELIALERPAAERLRLVIDRADGVDLALCESVTRQLEDLNEDWSIEVSSPGPERPLTKPEHFERFVGHRARVRTREPIGGQRIFTGEIEEADDDRVSLAGERGTVTIPLASVRRSNLLADDEEMRA
jgi:ribosome maturation factor RimP